MSESSEPVRRTPLFSSLKRNEQRGSKPRCHLLTHGTATDVARRLNAIVAPVATVSDNDRWMPEGFDDVREPQLHLPSVLLDGPTTEQLRSWWLEPQSYRAKTPNFDIASTCTIEGRRGLVLIEAKAYDQELKLAAGGRPVDDTPERMASHEKIGAAIAAANVGLGQATGLTWNLSRDSHYQMSNRFAWAWKLTTLGVPVALVYLGFLEASEMSDRGTPFADDAGWRNLVLSHSASLFPSAVWGTRWNSSARPLIPLIKSTTIEI